MWPRNGSTSMSDNRAPDELPAPEEQRKKSEGQSVEADLQPKVTSTSSGRRWFAAVLGLVVFIVCLMISASIISSMLGKIHNDHWGSEPAILLLWLIAGSVSGALAVLPPRWIAPDLDRKITFYNAVVVLIIFALTYAAGEGFTFGVIAHAVTPLVIGGFFGIKSGTGVG